MSSLKELETSSGPADEREARALEEEMGFGYRAALGELLYAYVTCRLDIGYAVAELSKFSSNPAKCHYQAIKRVFRYLRETKDFGLVYWRPSPRLDLPFMDQPRRALEGEEEFKFPYPAKVDQLGGYLDAAHAGCLKTRRSVGGYASC